METLPNVSVTIILCENAPNACDLTIDITEHVACETENGEILLHSPLTSETYGLQLYWRLP